MYRLVLYYLIGIAAVAVVLSYFGIFQYGPIAIIFSILAITIICLIANYIFSVIFEAPTNFESVFITALILGLIIAPPHTISDINYFILAGWASVWAMASKYIFAIGKKHIFNPAAFAVALTALAINQSANWWVGSSVILAPFVLFGGWLVVRKLRKFDLVISFLIFATISIAGFSLLRGANMLASVQRAFMDTPILFFVFVMLTEPLTTPPTKTLRVLYGAAVGLIFAPAVHIGSLYSTPELALLTGNLFSYLISPKEKLVLKLKNIIKIATDTYDFVFSSDSKLKFKPGQYLEWTLAHDKRDNRGNRRYFTIASSPTETDIRIGVKFYPQASSFKKALGSFKEGDTIIASQLAGDFVLPKNKSKKLVFIAGGIGITPFRSMVKYLLDTKEARTITLFYSVKTPEEIAYKDIFDEAQQQLGIKSVYTLTDKESASDVWQGEKGFVDSQMIMRYVADYKERIFYISGPHSMVATFEEVLKKMGVSKNHIKIDFFPGFV